MKNICISFFTIGLYVFYFHLFQVNVDKPMAVFKLLPTNLSVVEPEPTLKQKALIILQTKCNSCHKKKNPFKVFSAKNMNRHARKIYKQVFVYRRMPKSGGEPLTEEEYQTLENWINSTK